MNWINNISEITDEKLENAQQYFREKGYSRRIEHLVIRDYKCLSMPEKKELLENYYHDKLCSF